MGYLKDTRGYLSGAIEHTDSLEWVENARKVLTKEFGINMFIPFTDPKQQWVPKLNKARDNKDFQQMADIARNFVRKDLCWVDRSDFLIAQLPYQVATTGTHHEIINSNNAKKPTLLVCPQGKHKVPLWYYGFIPHRFMFGSWEELYKYLREVDEGKHKDEYRWAYVYNLV